MHRFASRTGASALRLSACALRLNQQSPSPDGEPYPWPCEVAASSGFRPAQGRRRAEPRHFGLGHRHSFKHRLQVSHECRERTNRLWTMLAAIRVGSQLKSGGLRHRTPKYLDEDRLLVDNEPHTADGYFLVVWRWSCCDLKAILHRGSRGGLGADWRWWFLVDCFTALGFAEWVLYLLPVSATLFLWRPFQSLRGGSSRRGSNYHRLLCQPHRHRSDYGHRQSQYGPRDDHHVGQRLLSLGATKNCPRESKSGCSKAKSN